MTSLRERHKACNTMLCLIQGLIGQETTVELRNEDFVYGKVSHVDGFMNIEMEKVVYTSHGGEKKRFDSFYIQGKNIRFVRIPDDVNIRHTMSKQLKLIQNVRTNTERHKRQPDKDVRKQLREEKIQKRLEQTKAAVARAAAASKAGRK